MKTVLTIAGSDCSGGAGIQADLKTIAAHGLYGMSAVTALTAQNTTGVKGILDVPPDFLRSQLDCIFTDIFPDAVKIGMLSAGALITVTAEVLREYQPKHVVLDPVMVSSSGRALLTQEAELRMKEELLSLVDLMTPNIPEAETLSGRSIENERDMEDTAKCLSQQYRTAVLVKGGHKAGGADDVLYDGECLYWYRGERLDNPNTHGTGCTLSSAIACRLAEGCTLDKSVRLAKEYLTGAIRANLQLGSGSGPLNHNWREVERIYEDK